MKKVDGLAAGWMSKLEAASNWKVGQRNLLHSI